jgi:hypothetical protein
MKYPLSMLMTISRYDKEIYQLILSYYIKEQKKFGRSLKQIKKDFDQLTCLSKCTISSCITIDNTKEGRAYWKSIEKKYESRYTNLF